MILLAVGDIVGNPGRKIVKELLPKIRKDYNVDIVIANGENSAGGFGITYITAQELYSYGVDVITMGNHVWSKKEIMSFIDEDTRIIRPANLPDELPGTGSTIVELFNHKVAVINLIGRIFMEPADSPFNSALKEIEKFKNEADIIIVDFHAEATSEKLAMGWFLDGKANVVFGTHTHVQTADERILPNGTGYITDLGMTGPYNSIIGVEKDIIVKKFVTQLPEKFEIAKGEAQFNAVVFEIDDKSKQVVSIKRIFELRKLKDN
ncbi:MAG: TIGR00282 family metallophosphoesterase [Deltaproteobacteria bacterium]